MVLDDQEGLATVTARAKTGVAYRWPPSEVRDMIIEWTDSDGNLNVEPGDLVLHAGRFVMVTSVEAAEWIGERGRDGVRVGLTGVMVKCSFPADSLVAVRRYITEG